MTNATPGTREWESKSNGKKFTFLVLSFVVHVDSRPNHQG